MPKKKEEDVKLKINIKNFKGVSKCPICGMRPEEIEWSREGLRIWCNEYLFSSKHKESAPVKIFEPIYPEELDIVKVTKKLIESWNTYCKNMKARIDARG